MSAMTSKGQVTIPKRVRDALGLKPGSEVAFEFRGGGEAIVRRADRARPKSPFAKLRGSLKSGMTTDEIMALTRGR
jgi:AbrB family looped-hinge helix DNA binding protein